VPAADFVTVAHAWLDTAFHAPWLVVTVNVAVSAVVPSAAKAIADLAGLMLSLAASLLSFPQPTNATALKSSKAAVIKDLMTGSLPAGDWFATLLFSFIVYHLF
jgi:hypothetical protein